MGWRVRTVYVATAGIGPANDEEFRSLCEIRETHSFDQEYVFVQSELYLSPDGGVGARIRYFPSGALREQGEYRVRERTGNIYFPFHHLRREAERKAREANGHRIEVTLYNLDMFMEGRVDELLEKLRASEVHDRLAEAAADQLFSAIVSRVVRGKVTLVEEVGRELRALNLKNHRFPTFL